MRTPDYVCDILININKKFQGKKNVINFYSRGCEDIIIKYKNNSKDTVFTNGYVEHKILKQAMEKSGILVSIGNKNSDMVPSKIFEYMSTGKKIIHFYNDKEDSCIGYYKKYQNALLVNINEDFETNLNTVNDFVNKKINLISINDIEDIFIQNTPKFTVDKIETFFNLKEQPNVQK